MIKNADLPAMPLTGDPYIDIQGHGSRGGRYEDGMGLTKREHLAGLAMQGLCAHSSDYHRPEHLAQDAVMHADALLAELERTQ
jgi:hypothetical protein